MVLMIIRSDRTAITQRRPVAGNVQPCSLMGLCRTLGQASGEQADADILSECDRAGARRSFCPPWARVRALHRVPAFRDALPRILDPDQRRTELRLARLVASDSRILDLRRGARPKVTLRVHCGTGAGQGPSSLVCL